jgi:hypothetical protein
MFPSVETFVRAALLLGAGATALIGCPLFDDDCDERDDCTSGFYCDRFSRRCEPVQGGDGFGCVRPNECETGETCAPDFVCRPGSCDYHGCVSGYRCSVVDSAHACVPAEAAVAPDASADASIEGASAGPGEADGGGGSTGVDDAGSGANP